MVVSKLPSSHRSLPSSYINILWALITTFKASASARRLIEASSCCQSSSSMSHRCHGSTPRQGNTFAPWRNGGVHVFLPGGTLLMDQSDIKWLVYGAPWVQRKTFSCCNRFPTEKGSNVLFSYGKQRMSTSRPLSLPQRFRIQGAAQ